MSCFIVSMKLYILSNKLPVKANPINDSFVFTRSEGGLTTGLNSLQIRYEKHWIGWPGICVDKENEKQDITAQLEVLNFHPVFLTETHIENYY